MGPRFLTLILILISLISINARAQFDEAGFKQALKVKRNAYLSEATFSGGDRKHSDFRVDQVRVAPNPAGYDRLVIELSGNTGGLKTPLDLPPYFMVENDPNNKRVQVTVFGKAKLDFSSQSAIQQARKAKHIARLDFIPLVDQDRWTWTIKTQVPVKAEVFELSEPARIIIDVKP